MAVFLLGQVYGVRQWGLFLVISRPASSHAQSIIAHSIMYQSLQTPSIAADPVTGRRSKPPPSLTPTEGQGSQTGQRQMKTCGVSARQRRRKTQGHHEREAREEATENRFILFNDFVFFQIRGGEQSMNCEQPHGDPGGLSHGGCLA